MTEYIKNRGGKVIGRTEGDRIYDRGGKMLGRWNKSENRTYDRGGKYIGQGDLRMTLLTEN